VGQKGGKNLEVQHGCWKKKSEVTVGEKQPEVVEKELGSGGNEKKIEGGKVRGWQKRENK